MPALLAEVCGAAPEADPHDVEQQALRKGLQGECPSLFGWDRHNNNNKTLTKTSLTETDPHD